MLFHQRSARASLRSRFSVMALALALVLIAASAMARAPQALAASPCYACTFAATSDHILWETPKPLANTTPQDWRRIGPAPATATMVGDLGTGNGIGNGKLWAVNNDHLEYRDTSDEYDPWKQVDTAYGINALTQTSGNLWGTAGNTLWTRTLTTAIAPWISKFDGTGVVALTVSNNTMFAVRNNELWYRPVSSTTTSWTRIQYPVQDAVGIVSLATDPLNPGKLIAVSSDNYLWTRDAVTGYQGWHNVGRFSGARVVAIATSKNAF